MNRPGPFTLILIVCGCLSIGFAFGTSRRNKPPIQRPGDHVPHFATAAADQAMNHCSSAVPTAGDSLLVTYLATAPTHVTGGVTVPKGLELQRTPGDLKAVPQVADAAARDNLRQALEAKRVQLRTIAHNLANADTVGFKRSRVLLEDCSYKQCRAAEQLDTCGSPSAVGIAIGQGVRVSAVQADFEQGALKSTGQPLDLAIEGRGFFPIADSTSGERWYTRAGHFAINANGELVLASATTSRRLSPAIWIPPDSLHVSVTDTGEIQVRQPGNNQLSAVGTIQLASFPNPAGLERLGANLYRETDASGAATLGNPGQNGVGVVRQNCLERSNVDLKHELEEYAAVQRSVAALRKNLAPAVAPFATSPFTATP